MLRTIIFCCAMLAMNVGNLFRGTYTSHLTAKTLPYFRSDLASLALTSVPILTTSTEGHGLANGAKNFSSFLTDEIKHRLLVAVNTSNIYNILSNIMGRTNFLLSSWYDFALNISNNHPIETHNGYKPPPEIFVLMDEEVACEALIKLLTINNAYFPIFFRSSDIYTAIYLYMSSSTLVGRTLSPGLSGLQESGILDWWRHRNADRGLLNPGTYYSNKTYFGTDLHRALIHWPPTKSPGFENDVVGLRNFVMFGCILIFLYLSSGVLALREVLYHRETRENIHTSCLCSSCRQPTNSKCEKIHVVQAIVNLVIEPI